MNRADLFLASGAVAFTIALIVAAVIADKREAKSAPPSYVFCTVDDRPTFVIPDALGVHFDEAGLLHARDNAGTLYAYALRPGEACQLTESESAK